MNYIYGLLGWNKPTFTDSTSTSESSQSREFSEDFVIISGGIQDFVKERGITPHVPPEENQDLKSEEPFFQMDDFESELASDPHPSIPTSTGEEENNSLYSVSEVSDSNALGLTSNSPSLSSEPSNEEEKKFVDPSKDPLSQIFVSPPPPRLNNDSIKERPIRIGRRLPTRGKKSEVTLAETLAPPRTYPETQPAKGNPKAASNINALQNRLNLRPGQMGGGLPGTRVTPLNRKHD